jgi:hypothetical protein
MPIVYERDDSRRLIVVTVTEPYTAADVMNTVDRQATEDAWDYAMLYDLHAPMLIPADSQQVAAHVEHIGAGRRRGAVGIAISGGPEQFRRGLRYGELSRQSATTVEVLLTAAQRNDWLERNARQRPAR